MPLIRTSTKWSGDEFLEIKNGILKKQTFAYSLLFSKTKKVWAKVAALLKQLIMFCTKYSISRAQIDLAKIADLAEDEFVIYTDHHMLSLF